MKKLITFFIGVIIFAGIFVALFSAWTLSSLPSLIVDNAINVVFGNGRNNDKAEKQLAYIQDYTLVANETFEYKDEEIARAEESLSDCDEINIYDNFWVNWIDILTVDTHRVQQNFKKFNRRQATKIGEAFVEISTSKRWEKRSSTTTNEDGTTSTTYYEVLVGTIRVEKRSLEDTAFHQFYLKDNPQKSVKSAIYMYGFLSEIYAEESVDADYVPGEFGDIPISIEGENITTLKYYYNQMTGSFARLPYGPKGYSTYAQAGCGPTAAAIIFASLEDDPGITPTSMGDWFYKKGLRPMHSGTAWSCMTESAKKFGYSSDYFSPSAQKLMEHLSAGRIVSTVQGRRNNALYTGTGHFIILNGIRNNNGKTEVYVTDPAYTNKIGWWDINIVLEGSKNMTAIW